MAKNVLQQITDLITKGAKGAFQATPPGIALSSLQRTSKVLESPKFRTVTSQAVPKLRTFVTQRITQPYTQRLKTEFQKVGRDYPQLTDFISTQLEPRLKAYQTKPFEAYRLQLKETPSLYLKGFARSVPAERAKFLVTLGQKIAQGKWTQPFTPEEQKVAGDILGSLVALGIAPGPAAVSQVGLPQAATRAYSTYLKGLKKYGIPETATPEQVGGTFEAAILEAEGSPQAVKTVIKDFGLLRRIKPDEAIRNLDDAVDWFTDLLRKDPQLKSGAVFRPPAGALPPVETSKLTNIRNRLVTEGLAAEEAGDVVLANNIRRQIIEIDKSIGRSLKVKEPPKAKLKPAQETILRTTGEGRISGEEVNRQLDKMWSERMQTAAPSAVPIAGAITQAQLAEQMGETPLAPEEAKQKEVIKKTEPSKEIKEISTEIPRVTPEGFDFPVETPVLKAVTTLYPSEKTVSSGFHTAWEEPAWAIVFQGKVNDNILKAAEQADLVVRERKSGKNVITDIYLPDVKVNELDKAQAVFDKFADSYLALKEMPVAEVPVAKAVPARVKKMSTSELIEAYQRTGRVAYQYARGRNKGKISLNGARPIPEQQAVKRMQEVVSKLEVSPAELDLLRSFAEFAPATIEQINQMRDLVARISKIDPAVFEKESGTGQRRLAQGALMRITEEAPVPTPVATPEGVQDTVNQLEATIVDDLVAGNEEIAMAKLGIRDELVKTAQESGFTPAVTPYEELVTRATEMQTYQEGIMKEVTGEVGAPKVAGVPETIDTQLLANHPNIQQYASLIRNAVLSWKKTKETNDIAGMEKKYPGLDEVAQAIRDITNKDVEPNMQTLADILSRFPKGTFKGVLGRKEGEKVEVAEAPPVPPSGLPPIPPPKRGEKMRGFIETVLKSETATKEFKEKIINDIHLFYKQKGNLKSFEEARELIARDRENTIATIIDPKAAHNETLAAAAELLMNELQYEKNFDLAKKILDADAAKRTTAGRVAQISAAWNRLTPQGMLQYGYRTVEQAIEDIGSAEDLAAKIASKIGIRRFPTKQEIQASKQLAKDVSEEMVKVNKEVLDEVTERVVKKVQEKQIESEEEKNPDILLAERISRYAKSLLKTEEKEQDPIMMMVRTLYQVAREVLPDPQRLPPNDLEFVADAIANKEEYKDIWIEAKDIVKEKFADNEDALELLDEYFSAYLERPFSTKQLERVVREGIKREDKTVADMVARVVRTYYLDKQKAFGETLARRLSEEAGLSSENARYLEGYVTDEFKRLTSQKKESILKNMTKTVKKLEKQKFWQKAAELSNLGAFSDSRYFDLIAKRLKIPNISEAKANAIFELTQKMQQLKEGTVEHKAIRRQVMDLISDEVPLGVLDIFEAYRYQNLLSSPRTQLRNYFWDELAGSVIVPTELLVRASADYFNHTLRGTERDIYFRDVPNYFRAYFNSIPAAFHQAKDALKGNIIPDNPDLRNMKFAKLRKEYPKLTVIPSIMEAVDQWQLTRISQGLSAIYQSHGIDSETATQMGLAEAQAMLLRAKLDPQNKTGQGGIAAAFDKFAVAIGALRTAFPPLKLIIPFIQVSTQFSKQAFFYSPVGGFAIFGSKTSGQFKKQYAAKSFVGWLALTAGFILALQGRTTWDVPDDEKERTIFWDSGKRPYSIRIGNIWIPMIYFGPLFTSLAVYPAWKHYNEEGKSAISDTHMTKISKVFLGLGKSYMDLSFLSNLGNFFAALEGDGNVPNSSFWSNLVSQYSPLVGFTRYLATIVDPTFRKTKGFWDAVKKNYPFLTKTLEPYRNLKGEESKREIINYILPYDVGIHNPEAYYLLRQRQKQLQFNNVINNLVKEIDVPDDVKGDDLKEMEYISTHPETTYVKILNSLKNKLSDLGIQEFALYRDTVTSPETKGDMLDSIEQQKEEIMEQVNEVHQEILKLQGKEGPMLFDEVEAAEYAKDMIYFREGMQPEINKIQEQADTFYEKVKEQTNLKEKYKSSREWFRTGMQLGENGIDRAKKIAEQAGLDPKTAEYDFLTSLDTDSRRIYVYEQIENKSGQGLWDTLLQMRRQSPGTGDVILTNNLIDDLVDEEILIKADAKKLKEIRLDIKGEAPREVLKAATGKSKKVKLTAMPVLQLKYPRISVPKIEAPKIKIKKIIPPKFEVKATKITPITIPKLRLKQIRVPQNMRELMAL